MLGLWATQRQAKCGIASLVQGRLVVPIYTGFHSLANSQGTCLCGGAAVSIGVMQL